MIGDDRVLCLSRRGQVKIYDFPEPQHFGGGTDGVTPQYQSPPNHKPIWSHSLSGSISQHPVYTSPLYYDGTVYRLVARTDNGIWGLLIPATKDDNPSTIQLSKFSSGMRQCVPGVYKAYALHGRDGIGIRVGYGWDDNGLPTTNYCNGQPKSFPVFTGSPNFDELSGRIVYCLNSDIMVADFLHERAETSES